MKEGLKKQLDEYQAKYDQNYKECISLMKQGKPWKEHARLGAKYKMMVEATVLQMIEHDK